MNAEYGAKPITCPKPVLRRRIRSSYALEPVVNLDFQWAGRHPAHQCIPGLWEKYAMKQVALENFSEEVNGEDGED